MGDEVDVKALVAELGEERRRRETLELRVNEMSTAAAAAERASAIRAELQRLGVTKVELAYKAVREDLGTRGGGELVDYLTRFVAENPELLPARLAGGSGASPGSKSAAAWGQRGYRQDSTGNERGRNGPHPAGDRAGGVADATRDMKA